MVNLFKRIRRRLFPNKLEKTARQWCKDGGDDKYRFDYNLTSQSLILDLGGYDGQWASDIFGRFACQIYVFEPVSEYAQDISNRFANNASITIESFALGRNSRQDSISIDSTGSSMYRSSENREIINIVDVGEWFAREAINRVDLMKVNIEGGEYELLSRMLECDLMTRVDNLQIQFHEINKNSKQEMIALQNQLKKTHRLTFQYPFIWENWTIKN